MFLVEDDVPGQFVLSSRLLVSSANIKPATKLASVPVTSLPTFIFIGCREMYAKFQTHYVANRLMRKLHLIVVPCGITGVNKQGVSIAAVKESGGVILIL